MTSQTTIHQKEYIDLSMISGHLHVLCEFHDDERTDVAHLERYIEATDSLRSRLSAWCDSVPFKKGLHVLLADPKTDFENLVTSTYSYSQNEGRKMAEFVWKQLWPNDPIPTEPLPNVEVIPISYNRFADDWDVARGRTYHTKAGDTFRRMAKKFNMPLEELLKLNPYNANKFGVDDAFEAFDTIRLRDTNLCTDRDDRGLYFHELPIKAQRAIQTEHAIQHSGTPCRFSGSWILTHVDGKSVDLITRKFNEGDLLPHIDGKPAQWQFLIDKTPMDD